MLGTKVTDYLASAELLTQIQRRLGTLGTKEVSADLFRVCISPALLLALLSLSRDIRKKPSSQRISMLQLEPEHEALGTMEKCFIHMCGKAHDSYKCTQNQGKEVCIRHCLPLTPSAK